MSKPIVHIYLLSRLAFADVTDWQKIIKQLRDGRKSMYWSYKPLRTGAYRLASRDGTDPRAIYADVANLAQAAGGERCRSANVAALEAFENIFLPEMTKAKSNFMEGPSLPVDFGAVQLVGGPHFSAVGNGSRDRFVYLHPSRWELDEITAFCELLTVIVEKRFGARAQDILFLDIRNRARIPWPRSRSLVRRKCRQAAEFLVALQGANLLADEQ